jgi:hypothetical protein
MVKTRIKKGFYPRSIRVWSLFGPCLIRVFIGYAVGMTRWRSGVRSRKSGDEFQCSNVITLQLSVSPVS